MLTPLVDYLIQFLLYGNRTAQSLVAYSDKPQSCAKAQVIILPDPRSPLYYPEQKLYVPDLSAKVQIEPTASGQYLCRTDLVYNAFFLLSRAEEVLNPKRDAHGRFLAAYSVLQAANKIAEPLVDEYAFCLLQCLQLPLPKPGIQTLNLTHDVDTIAFYRHLRGFLGGLKRGQLKAAVRSLQNLHNDPAYTFPWLFEQEKKFETRPIYFFKATAGRGLDYPQYPLQGPDCQQLLLELSEQKAQIGLHSSYQAGADPSLVRLEREKLETALGQPVCLNRWHYLRTQHPADFRALLLAGLQHDYTMAFPDQVGFRLGTARPVRWIDPERLELTDLVLHPLTLMDVTLQNSNYMHLTQPQAYQTACALVEQTKRYAGELTLLWHNSNLSNGYLKALYADLLKTLL